jgi:hypothetical protein
MEDATQKEQPGKLDHYEKKSSKDFVRAGKRMDNGVISCATGS